MLSMDQIISWIKFHSTVCDSIVCARNWGRSFASRQKGHVNFLSEKKTVVFLKSQELILPDDHGFFDSDGDIISLNFINNEENTPIQKRHTKRSLLCPQAEELELLTSHDRPDSSSESLVDTNSSALSLDTYHQPPMPVPFGSDLGSPQSTNSEFAGTQISGSSLQEAGNPTHMEFDCKAQEGTAIASSGRSELEVPHLTGANVSTTEEEDVCPICFEDYTAENPMVDTKCNHNFHLSCIYNWLERNDTCPMCNQEMDFEV